MDKNLEVIGQNSQVEMHFDIRLKDGSVADSTRHFGRPMPFQMGTGVFAEKLEVALLGLKAGDKKKIMLLPDEAFGEPHPANIYQVPRSKFMSMEQEAPLEIGMIIEFEKVGGKPAPGILMEMTDDEVTIDFNHPLAGQVVLFDIEIMSVASGLPEHPSVQTVS